MFHVVGLLTGLGLMAWAVSWPIRVRAGWVIPMEGFSTGYFVLILSEMFVLGLITAALSATQLKQR